jgi:hypothetical protein
MVMKQTVQRNIRGHDSSVGIATRYGLDSSELEPRWGKEISYTHSSPDGALGPPSGPVARGMMLTTDLHLKQG